MVKFIALLIVACALALPATASAHGWDAWYWSPSRANYRLLTDTRTPSLFRVHYDIVTAADCYGIGPRLRGMYKHFDCEFTLGQNPGSFGTYEDTFERILHVTGARTFVLSGV